MRYLYQMEPRKGETLELRLDSSHRELGGIKSALFIPLNTKAPKRDQMNFSSGKICLREQFSSQEI